MFYWSGGCSSIQEQMAVLLATVMLCQEQRTSAPLQQNDTASTVQSKVSPLFREEVCAGIPAHHLG
jgi:hypothetical protein